MREAWRRCLDPLDRPAPPVKWTSAAPPGDRRELRRWRAAVGPARVGAGVAPEVLPGAEPGGRRLRVVSWNVRVGGGAVRSLWRRLAGGGGIAAGCPVVLLLQEVFAGGPHLPAAAAGSAWAERISDRPPGEERADIVSFAGETGLHLVYVPSMRNGPPDDGGPPEDRGNAILANVPLSSPQAIELPFERQRRVAVAATVTFGAGTVALCSVHLDNRAPWTRMWRSLGVARRRQMAGLLTVFAKPEAEDAPGRPDAYALGGDFNTWLRGRAESSYKVARKRFPQPERPDSAPTHRLEVGGWLRHSDHLLFRLPAGWRGECRRLDHAFGSDHYPLDGTVERRTGSGSQTGRSVNRG